MLSMKPDDLVGKGAFEKKKIISADLELKASDLPYIIIPCTFYPNAENTFSLSVLPSTSPSDVRLKLCPDDWRKAVADVWLNNRFSLLRTELTSHTQGQWVKGKTAGGCRNYKSWLSNPQFSMRLKSKCEVVVILCQRPGSENIDNSIGFYIIQTNGALMLDF